MLRQAFVRNKSQAAFPVAIRLLTLLPAQLCGRSFGSGIYNESDQKAVSEYCTGEKQKELVDDVVSGLNLPQALCNLLSPGMAQYIRKHGINSFHSKHIFVDPAEWTLKPGGMTQVYFDPEGKVPEAQVDNLFAFEFGEACDKRMRDLVEADWFQTAFGKKLVNDHLDWWVQRVRKGWYKPKRFVSKQKSLGLQWLNEDWARDDFHRTGYEAVMDALHVYMPPECLEILVNAFNEDQGVRRMICEWHGCEPPAPVSPAKRSKPIPLTLLGLPSPTPEYIANFMRLFGRRFACFQRDSTGKVFYKMMPEGLVPEEGEEGIGVVLYDQRTGLYNHLAASKDMRRVNEDAVKSPAFIEALQRQWDVIFKPHPPRANYPHPLGGNEKAAAYLLYQDSVKLTFF